MNSSLPQQWKAETLVRKKAKDIFGVIHEITEDWYLVEEISAFRFDGFALISTYSVDSRRHNRFDKTLGKILAQHGGKPSRPPITIKGLEDEEIFAHLRELDVFISLEAADESRFLLGTIHRVSKGRLFVKHFPADGKWFKRPTGINIADVGRVCFGDEYGMGWQRYFERQKADPQ